MISIFDLFKIGIGPSSSHTVGPMRAAHRFATHIEEQGDLARIQYVKTDLFGSLGATGKGHRSDKAIILGFQGYQPDTVDPTKTEQDIAQVQSTKVLNLLGHYLLPFQPSEHLCFHPNRSLPFHPNALQFTAFGHNNNELFTQTYYSIGGGFVIQDTEIESGSQTSHLLDVPYPFGTAEELLRLCKTHTFSISQLMLENEQVQYTEKEIRQQLLEIWGVMQTCVRRGCEHTGTLPGGLGLVRRAAVLYNQLCQRPEEALRDPLSILDWITLYALAVNEENAAGGRVVTAPTNGAAGIIPAVLHYWERFRFGANEDTIVRFLLTAGAIGILYKENASISGADVGCQGEVGVACSMAAGALCEVLGGTPEQVENAAEIGMEHNLGLTCDPVAGLVQIPCIERNAMGAIKAIQAARIALRGDGTHYVSLDKVIKTMHQTGIDMQSKYKETAQGGLAVNVIEC